MSEMAERVVKSMGEAAREYCDHTGLYWEDIPLSILARAAIEAMREPTEEMLSAADSAIPRAEINPDTGVRMMGREVALAAWIAAFDAALKE